MLSRNRFCCSFFKRYLHDRKLPGIYNGKYYSYNGKYYSFKLQGTDSPRKFDFCKEKKDNNEKKDNENKKK